MGSKVIEVLIAEDDSGDVELMRESLKNSKLQVNLHHVEDGQECMDFLKKTGKHKNAVKPDLLLLDLNMPKKDGRKVLEELKADPNLKKIPTVILTTSDAGSDINQTYELGANCYITKPVDFDKFKKIANDIAEFWFTVVKLPEGQEG